MSTRLIQPIASRLRLQSVHSFGSATHFTSINVNTTSLKRPHPTTTRSFLTSTNDHDHHTSHARSIAEFHTSHATPFYTQNTHEPPRQSRPGSIAFGECEINALSDLFFRFAQTSNSVDDHGPYLDRGRIQSLLESVGETPDETTLETLFERVNLHKDGKLRLDCFLRAADQILGQAPARIVLIVGGPGSGKGALCERLERECGVVHLSCGEMLREEVEAQTPLGREVSDIMSSGGLVSSAVVTALMRRRMRQHPGRRILLDGFPRSLENARDFMELCGPPELALHLDCEDTILLERILARGGQSAKEAERAAAEGRKVNVRSDDNVHTAIRRLKNYHKHHKPTMDWLKSQKVPIVELDCSGTKEEVWEQLMAIGRLMRPAVKIPPVGQLSRQPESEVNDLQWIA